MKKRLVFFTLALFIVFTLLDSVSFAEEDVGFVKKSWRKFLESFKQPGEEAPAPERGVKEKAPGVGVKKSDRTPPGMSPLTWVSKEEIKGRIINILDIDPEVLDYIPELRAKFDDEFNLIELEYNLDGMYVDIGVLEKKELINIHNRINNERLRLQTERIQRQVTHPTPPHAVPQPPTIVTPPEIPRPPKVPYTPPAQPPSPPPPTPPKVPSTPPLPPSVPQR